LLPKEIIKYSRMSDINKETRAEGCLIKSVEFHKKQSVALVGGDSGVLTLFQVCDVKYVTFYVSVANKLLIKCRLAVLRMPKFNQSPSSNIPFTRLASRQMGKKSLFLPM